MGVDSVLIVASIVAVAALVSVLAGLTCFDTSLRRAWRRKYIAHPGQVAPADAAAHASHIAPVPGPHLQTMEGPSPEPNVGARSEASSTLCVLGDVADSVHARAERSGRAERHGVERRRAAGDAHGERRRAHGERRRLAPAPLAMAEVVAHTAHGGSCGSARGGSDGGGGGGRGRGGGRDTSVPGRRKVWRELGGGRGEPHAENARPGVSPLPSQRC